jgi:glycosyltransferase involved in cell wall biosynthesis
VKICILTSAHPPYDARIFYKEARSLRKAGYEVTIIAPGKPGKEDISVPGTELSTEGIRVRYVPPFKSRRERFLNVKNIYFAALEEKADIYHFHDPDLIRTGLKLQKVLQKPVIYDVHEYFADSLRSRYWIPRPLRPLAAGIFDRMEKRAARKFAGIITVNSHMDRLFKRHNPEGEILYNFPLKEQFNFERPDFSSQEKRLGKILYLGGINRERGLEVILEAMVLVKDRYPDAVCEMIGLVDTGGLSGKYLPLEPWLEKGSIKMRGKIPYSEVPAILKSSGIALVPLLPTLNYQKAIPVKLIEYMASGLAIVGSRFGHIENIIRENACGRLAEPGDPVSLAEEICFLLSHPEEALVCAQNGWEAFQNKYCWENEEKKLLSLYQRILSKNK